mmetsp:Transcript_25925/g.74718  ORF Transcript_25925/g.74718 Transcript_25925/m.74718 type:complete len:950 (+) Transcript_25925:36-2885(+)
MPCPLLPAGGSPRKEQLVDLEDPSSKLRAVLEQLVAAQQVVEEVLCAIGGAGAFLVGEGDEVDSRVTGGHFPRWRKRSVPAPRTGRGISDTYAPHVVKGVSDGSSRLASPMIVGCAAGCGSELMGSQWGDQSSGSDQPWPACVKLRPYVLEIAKTMSAVKCYTEVLDTAGVVADDGYGSAGQWRDPHSIFHLTWSFIGLVVLFADSTITPFAIAWDVPLLDMFSACFYMSLAYQGLDIVCAFFTGFYRDGLLVTGKREIARRYLRTTFVLDVLLLAVDALSIAFLLLGTSPSGVWGMSFAELGEALRALLVLRMLRSSRLFGRISERILLERARMVFATVSVTIVMLWFIHIFSCLWWFIGVSSAANETVHWTDKFRSGKSSFDQYVAAYHWTIAQATLGANDIECTNSIERLFNIACLMLGLIVGSSLISVFSASLVELQMANKDLNLKMRTLRQYLRQHEVRPWVTLAVQRQVTERLRERKPLTEGQVVALELLSFSLRAALRFEVARASLLGHALFVQLSALDATWCYTFCHVGFEITSVSAQDDLFFTGAVAKAAYVLMKGRVEYDVEMRTCSSQLVCPPTKLVEQGAWLAEGALWSEWIHVGKAVAVSATQVLNVCPAGLSKSMKGCPEICQIACEYGIQFHRRIISAGCHGTPSPTDVCVPCTDWEDIVLSMHSEVQRVISLSAVSRLIASSRASSVNRGSFATSTRRASMSEAKHCELREEILAGKSIVVVNRKGLPERIVSVVVAHIGNDDGRLLVQVGKYERGVSTPTCELPGLKRESDELINDAWMRLRGTKLSALADVLQVQRNELVTATKSSKQHRVQTKYLRHIFYCCLSGDFDAPFCTALSPFDSERPPSWRGTGTWSLSLAAVGSRLPPAPHVVRRELGDFACREVYFLQYGAKGAFYAWLSSREFDYLSSPAGERVSSLWLRSLHDPLTMSET